jgi:hypothetical protein
LNVGTFDLTPSSIIQLSRTSTSSTAPLSADVLRLTAVPEPASLVVFALALGVCCAFYGWRRRSVR